MKNTSEKLESQANVKKKIETEEIWQEVCIMVQRRGGEREGNLGHQGGQSCNFLVPPAQAKVSNNCQRPKAALIFLLVLNYVYCISKGV